MLTITVVCDVKHINKLYQRAFVRAAFYRGCACVTMADQAFDR
jgi:hypothetical protein